MAAKKASTYLTGGGGFNFEDAIAALYLVSMLSQRHPFAGAFGAITTIKWQGGDEGWELDDLLILGDAGYEAGMSIKSEAHLKTTGFSSDFTQRSWRQFRGSTGRYFNTAGDLLCLSTGTISADVNRAWQLLCTQAQTTSIERLEERLEEPEEEEGSQSSQLQRDIVQSLIDNAPDKPSPTMQDALALLKHIRVLHFDFLGDPSQMKDLAIVSCQFMVEGGARADAESLWTKLLTIAKEYRQTGGDLNRDELIDRLGPDHGLAVLPNYAPHLDRWHNISTERLRYAKWGIVDTLPPMDRSNLWLSWERVLVNKTPIAIVGNTGAGKTSFVREHANRSGRRLYLLDNALMANGGVLYGGELSGTTYRLSELLNSETRPSVLLFDSVENMSAENIDLVCSILDAVKHHAVNGHLEIILSCQPPAFDRLRAALSRDGINYSVLAIPNPTNDEIKEWASNDSRLASLTEHEPLVNLLANLKVLELAHRAAASGVAIADQGHLRQTGVLDFLWTQWVENHGQSLVRGRLLQRLGIQDSDRLAAGHAVRDLEPGEIEYLPSLFEDGLLSKFEERVYFAHGFVADLSRMRVLLSYETPQISQRAENFQWHNAIKLFAQHLAEDRAHRWLKVFIEIRQQLPDRPRIVDTLFIDGLIAATEVCPELLSEAWPELSAVEQESVGLLLERLAIGGTRPDENWRSPLSPEIVSQPGPWRKCGGQSLMEALRILVAGGEIDDRVVSFVIGICEMVLRRHIIVGDVPNEMARNAAELACRAARHLVTQPDTSRGYWNCREAIYRAMLIAAAVKPEEAIELALYAAQRRPLPESEDISSVSDTSLVDLDTIPEGLLDSAFGTQEAAEPWPDGPLDSLDDEFQKVCLETDALIPLIEVEPSVAKEVLLACCIEEPRSRAHRGWGSDDEIGVVERVSRRMPLFDTGPFLEFFRTAPDEAVDIMLHLCNFATEQWFNSPARQRLEEHEGAWMGRRLGPFEMRVPNLDGTSNAWKGSSNIFRWSLGGLPPSRIITNTLMAFEYWVYEQVANNEDVSDYLSRLVSSGRSAGIAGCLIDIGKKYPDLFLGPLRPLLGCWVFYGWDRVVQVERSGMHEGLVGWGLFEPPSRQALAAGWHRAEHRTRDLLEVARFLFVRNPEFRQFMESSRHTWEQDFDGAGQFHGLRQLACVFDWRNYSIRNTEDNQQEVVYQPPEEFTRQAMGEIQQANEQQLLLTFPFQCRRLLENGEPLIQDQIDGLWQSIQIILNLTEEQNADGPFSDGGWSRKPDSLAAGAAVLLRLDNNLLTEEMVTFCRNCFESLLREEPQRRQFDLPESVGEHSWEFFLADMTIEYLKADSTDEAARWGVQRCITAFHYGALAHFMKLAHAERNNLGTLFPLLANYVIAWSAMREQIHRVHSRLSQHEEWKANTANHDAVDSDDSPALDRLRSTSEALSREFQQLSAKIVAWQPVETSWETQVEQSVAFLRNATQATAVALFREVRPHHDGALEHSDVGLDLRVLQHGFDWIDVSAANNDSERCTYIEHLLGLLVVQRCMVPEPSAKQRFVSYGYGHSFDLFLHQLVARNIVGGPQCDQSLLWKSKLSQLEIAPDQVREFLDLLCATAQEHQPEPGLFANVWISMLRFVSMLPCWTPKHDPPTVWTSLLGMRFEGTDTGWSQRLASELAAHEEVIVESFEIALRNPSCSAPLVRATCHDVWGDLRLRLMSTFASAFEHSDDAEFPSEQMARFLELCWDEHRTTLASNQEHNAVFTGLLGKSIRVGCPAAVHLAERIEVSKDQR